MNLPQLSQDKANHFIYGSIAAWAGACVAAMLGYPPPEGMVGGAFVAGVLKECYDYWTRRGTVDALDLVATTAGCLPLMIGSSF